MNRTIRDATIKRYRDDSHEQVRKHPGDFMEAYNFGRSLKTPGDLTPYKYNCKIWTSEPVRFSLDLIKQLLGLNP